MKPDVLIVVGASAGGVKALSELLKGLPTGLPAAVLVVLHVGSDSRLSSVLSHSGPHSVRRAADGEELLAGAVYVAPPARHMLLNGGSIRLSSEPRENLCRPAIDPLFRSAARHFGNRVIGVVLTGTRDDGAAGLFSIKSHGGIAVVQSPKEAQWPDMPRNASRHTPPDYVVPIAEMGPLLGELSLQLAAVPAKIQSARPKPVPSQDTAPCSCPDCGGMLTEEKLGDGSHFHCRIGHAYSLESLTEAHMNALERALWIAIRTLNEQVEMRERLANGFAARNQMSLSERLHEQADAARADMEMIKEVASRVVTPIEEGNDGRKTL